MLKLKILGVPKPKQSMRIGKTKSGKTISYQDSKVKENEYNLQWDIKSQLPEGFQPFTKAVTVKKLLYVFPPVTSLKKSTIKDIELGLLYPKTTKPDLTDNLNKGVFDAMQGIVFLNDSQIFEMNNVSKVYGTVPRIEIELEEI